MRATTEYLSDADAPLSGSIFLMNLTDMSTGPSHKYTTFLVGLVASHNMHIPTCLPYWAL